LETHCSWRCGWGHFNYKLDRLVRGFGAGYIARSSISLLGWGCSQTHSERTIWPEKEGPKKQELEDDKAALPVWFEEQGLVSLNGMWPTQFDGYTNCGAFCLLKVQMGLARAGSYGVGQCLGLAQGYCEFLEKAWMEQLGGYPAVRSVC